MKNHTASNAVQFSGNSFSHFTTQLLGTINHKKYAFFSKGETVVHTQTPIFKGQGSSESIKLLYI